MDFGLNPPEVNSARMYTGPGSGPMLAAATAWAALAADLELSAGAMHSTLGELATAWTGPSATAMAAAATPYVAWMHGAATVAEQTAAQAHAAAGAFEIAFAMTVPPPVVAANRGLLLMLIATNFFGQNTPAIAATEAAYAEMWAQDAAAMYGYAAAAAGATALPRFAPPAPVADLAGSVDEIAEAGRAVGTSVANTAGQALAKLSSTVHGASAHAAEAVLPTGPVGSAVAGELSAGALIELGLIPLHLGLDLFGAVVIDGLGLVAIDLPGAVGATMLREIAAAGSIPAVLAGATTPTTAAVTAGLGQAIPISGLSVPGSWASASGAEPAGRAATPPPAPAKPAAVPDRLSTGLAGMAGLRAMGGPDGERRATPQSGTRRTRTPRAPEIDVATELRELMDLHGSGILTDAEFAKERERLFAD